MDEEKRVPTLSFQEMALAYMCEFCGFSGCDKCLFSGMELTKAGQELKKFIDFIVFMNPHWELTLRGQKKNHRS